MEKVKNRGVLNTFAEQIYEFILSNHLEDKNDNLIMDYIQKLHEKGIDLRERDVEKEVYTFYEYHKRYNNLIEEFGEDKFIEIITDAELYKIN